MYFQYISRMKTIKISSFIQEVFEPVHCFTRNSKLPPLSSSRDSSSLRPATIVPPRIDIVSRALFSTHVDTNFSGCLPKVKRPFIGPIPHPFSLSEYVAPATPSFSPFFFLVLTYIVSPRREGVPLFSFHGNTFLISFFFFFLSIEIRASSTEISFHRLV